MDTKPRHTAEQNNAIESYEKLLELGNSYVSQGDFFRAQQCYEKTALLEPDESGPYVGLGVVALQNNSLDDAELAFKVAHRLDADCCRAYAGLAMVAQKKTDYETAFQMYLKCLERDTDNLTALLGLFQTSCRMGSFAKVIHYLQLYLDMHPNDTSVMFSLAALYLKEGNFEQAKKILSDILILDPCNKDAANLLEEIEHNAARTKRPGA